MAISDRKWMDWVTDGVMYAALVSYPDKNGLSRLCRYPLRAALPLALAFIN